MYDIRPPSNSQGSLRFTPKRRGSPRIQKGTWSHTPGGRHFDIVAKKKEKAKEIPLGSVKPIRVPIHERDIPYTFSRPAPVSQPRIPAFKISIPRKSSRIPGVLILLTGFLSATFVMWNLQAAGKITGVIASIESRVGKAIAYSMQAGSAIAETRTDAGQASFSLAGQEFVQAKQELDAALASSNHILEIMDVTGTISSSKKLLDAGALLVSAGEHMSFAMKPFLQITENSSLTDAIELSRAELVKTESYLHDAAEALSGVSTTLMPSNAQEKIAGLQEALPKVKNAIHQLNAKSNTLLTLLGADRDRQYLVLFANSDELRPVGGFIGTTALVNVARGKVENIEVKSVYDGDGQLKVAFAPPAQLAPIVDRWYLRDSNWFVDYRTSARKAFMLFEKEGGPTVDGVLLLTPQVIKNILAVTGPIHVPGYNVDVTAENFVTVTQGEVTYNYDRSVNKPKQFLADLAPILVSRLFADGSGTPESPSRLAMLEAVFKSLSEKDILLFFTNELAQKEVENLGWAGAIPENKQGFLMVDNANIGGHKSDQFIEQEIDHRSTIDADGNVDVVTTIRRTHKGPQEKIAYPYPEGEDPSKKDNVVFQRVLVPKDAVLLDQKGFTKYMDIPRPHKVASKTVLQPDPDIVMWQQRQKALADGTIVGQESGYQYFANWVVTKPGETSVVLYHYTIPHAVDMPSLLKPASGYSVALVKQPGQRRSTLRASMVFPEGMKVVRTAPESGITLDGDSSVVYRGDILRDMVIGAVFQK